MSIMVWSQHRGAEGEATNLGKVRKGHRLLAVGVLLFTLIWVWITKAQMDDPSPFRSTSADRSSCEELYNLSGNSRARSQWVSDCVSGMNRPYPSLVGALREHRLIV